jgi:flavodoxin long chain
VAEAIAEAWQAARVSPLALVNIADLPEPETLLAYDYLILGISTWNIGQLQDDREAIFPQLAGLDFSGRRVALFGIGDQVAYDENFLDAVGILGARLRARGAALSSRWPIDDYEFAASLALEEGALLGLGIDEINRHERTEERIARWVNQVLAEWALQPGAAVAGA